MNQNGFNFFAWIRDGVRQSVLMGVSDAMHSIGGPDENATLHPRIATLLQEQSGESSAASKVARLPGTSASAKKRLGKSLRDIGPQQP